MSRAMAISRVRGNLELQKDILMLATATLILGTITVLFALQGGILPIRQGQAI